MKKTIEILEKLVIPIFGVIATIAAAYYGANLGSQSAENLWHKQIDLQNKNAAKALYDEISRMSSTIDFDAAVFSDKSLNRDYSPEYIPYQYYDDKGVYYSFQNEIAGFPSNLSGLTYKYYIDLIKADEARLVVNEYSQILEENPNYKTRQAPQFYPQTTYAPGITPPQFFCKTAIENDPYVQKFYLHLQNQPWADQIVYEGYDPNLSMTTNIKITQGRLAYYNLMSDIKDAHSIQQTLLTELQKESEL